MVPPGESDAQRLGDRRGVDARRIRLVVEAVGGGIPELGIVPKLPLLLLGQIRDGHLDLNTRGLSCNSFHDIGRTIIRDRNSVGSGKSVSVRVELGGRSIIKKKKN